MWMKKGILELLWTTTVDSIQIARRLCCIHSVLVLLEKKTIPSGSSYIFVRLYKSLVWPLLDFGMCIASPGYRGDVQLLEGVQRRATTAVVKMRDILYDEHLKELKLSTLVYQQQANMLMTYVPTSQETPLYLSTS